MSYICTCRWGHVQPTDRTRPIHSFLPPCRAVGTMHTSATLHMRPSWNGSTLTHARSIGVVYYVCVNIVRPLWHYVLFVLIVRQACMCMERCIATPARMSVVCLSVAGADAIDTPVSRCPMPSSVGSHPSRMRHAWPPAGRDGEDVRKVRRS
jgi:hypothetical protein